VIQSIQLDEAELNRLLNYCCRAAPDQRDRRRTHARLATLTATLAVPPNRLALSQLTAEVADVPDGIRIQSLQLGSLPVPGALADGIAHLRTAGCATTKPTRRWLMPFPR